MTQTVTIKASNLLIHSALLVLVGGALIVLQIINASNTAEIKRTQTRIEQRIVPVCLNPDTAEVCADQLRTASDERVLILCKLVHDRLDLPVRDCVTAVREATGGGNSERPSGDARAGPADQSNAGGGSSSQSSSGSATSPGGTPSTPVSPTPPTDPGTGGGGGTGGGTGGGGGEPPGDTPGNSPPVPPGSVDDNGTCILNQTACINIQGHLDDNLLPDHVPPGHGSTPPGLDGALPPGLDR